MPVEGPITDISDLNEAWPLDSDLQTATDDHLRLTKDAIKKQFSDMSTNGGVVTVTATELNSLVGMQENVQVAIDRAELPWRTVTLATDSPAANEKLLCDTPFGGLTITLPDSPANGSELVIMDGRGEANTPLYQITVVRSGSDDILNLDQDPQSPVTSTGFQYKSEILTFVYFDGTWSYFSSAALTI